MIAKKPVCDGETLASIAVVVHALCDRDGMIPPAWVLSAKAAKPRLLSGHRVDNKFGEFVKAEAPAACFVYDVYFEAEMLDKGIPGKDPKGLRRANITTEDDILDLLGRGYPLGVPPRCQYFALNILEQAGL